MAYLSVKDPPSIFRNVSPSDSADLPDDFCRGLTCTGSGSVVVVGRDDDPDAAGVTINLVAGAYTPGLFRRVKATGTTATGIVALY